MEGDLVYDSKFNSNPLVMALDLYINLQGIILMIRVKKKNPNIKQQNQMLNQAYIRAL